MGEIAGLKGIKRNTIIKIMLYLGTFLFNCITCLSFYYPNLNDEYNVLSIAAFFAGKDWSAFAAATKSYHGFGQAVLYVPVFYLLEDPIWIYRGILIVNAMIISFTVPIIYHLLCKYYKNVKENHKVFFSLVLGTLPFYITYAKNAWNEPMCALVTLLIFVFVLRWMDAWAVYEKNILNTLVLAVLAGYGYMVHGRMLVFAIVIPVVLCIAILLSVHDKFTKKSVIMAILHLILYAAIFAAVWGLGEWVKSYLYDHLWGHAGLNASVSDFAERKLQYLLSFSNLKVLMKLMIGQVFYLITTTYGLGIAGLLGAMVVCGDTLTALIKKKKQRYSHIECTYGIMLVVSYGAALLLSAVSLLSGTLTPDVGRVDYVLYGRYTENIYPLMIGFALLFLYRNTVRKKMAFWGVCNGIFIAVCLVFVRFVIPLYLSLKRTGHSSITNIIPFSGATIVSGTNEEIYQSFFQVILISGCIFILLQILIYCKEYAAIGAVLLVISLYSFFYTMNERRIPDSVLKYECVKGITDVLQEIQILEDVDTLYFVHVGTEYPGQYQWAFMDENCKLLYSNETGSIGEMTVEDFTQEGLIISPMDVNMDYYLPAAFEIIDESLAGTGHKIWVVGEQLSTTLQEKGLSLERDKEMNFSPEKLLTANGMVNDTTLYLGNQGFVTTGPQYLMEGTYEIKITGSNVDECAYAVLSGTTVKNGETYFTSTIEYDTNHIECLEQWADEGSIYAKIKVDCNIKSFEVHVSNINDKNVEISSIEIINIHGNE